MKENSNNLLVNPSFTELPLGAIKPMGWLRDQLNIQAEGLTGNLEEIWEDVGSNSGWLGGTGESWERGPYYLDGLIPLAYLLDNLALKEKAQKWIEWILNSQQEDGFFGPEVDRDWWPRMVILKALIQYHSATVDERVIPFMTRYFKYQLSKIEREPLRVWARARGGENILCIYWLHSRTGEKFLLDLATVIYRQTLDWVKTFSDFPFQKPTGAYLNWEHFQSPGWEEISNPTKISKDAARRLFELYHQTHVVNVAMGLKLPAMRYLQSGDNRQREVVKNGIESLMRYHGLANGMFSGDEHLNGKSPSQGTELCSVVEYLFTLETLIGIFGDVEYADILEKVAYNALPAALKPDIKAHQYDQQTNQVLCTLAKRDWYNNGAESNIFGLQPHFGCCTANMHQGWPKFAVHLWESTPDAGLAAIAYGPCRVTARVTGGTVVSILEETDYPFDELIRLTITCRQKATFSLKLRIPGWAREAHVLVNGKETGKTDRGAFFSINRTWVNGDCIELIFSAKIILSTWYNNTIGIERGPLIFALKIGEKWRKLRGSEPFADWEVLQETPWNYGLMVDRNHPEKSFSVERNPLKRQPFDPEYPPIRLKAMEKRIDEWKIKDNSAAPPPLSPVDCNASAEEVVLIPYGCTNLRVAEIPEILTQ